MSEKKIVHLKGRHVSPTYTKLKKNCVGPFWRKSSSKFRNLEKRHLRYNQGSRTLLPLGAVVLIKIIFDLWLLVEGQIFKSVFSKFLQLILFYSEPRFKIQEADEYLLKEIVGAVVIFSHGLKFGIVFLVSDHPAHEKLIASKKSFLLSNN
jgi:hypothetical protein